MSDTHGPIWIITDPAQPYPDRRFDGVTPPLDPQDKSELLMTTDNEAREWCLMRRDDSSVCVYYTKPNDPAQYVIWDSYDEPKRQEDTRIADAARLAVRDMTDVFLLWSYRQTFPLPNLRALLDMLTPPAPKWTKDEDK